MIKKPIHSSFALHSKFIIMDNAHYLY